MIFYFNYVEQLQKEWQTKMNALVESVANIKQSDIYVVKNVNSQTRTTKLFRNFLRSNKKYLCIAKMFAIKYEYISTTESLFGAFSYKEKKKKVCWIDLIIQKDNLSYDRGDEEGITISELKMFSRYYLNCIKNKGYYLSRIYEELKFIENEFMEAMDNDQDYNSFTFAFEKPIYLRAQDYKFVQYGKTEDYLIVGARVSECDAPIRYYPMEEEKTEE